MSEHRSFQFVVGMTKATVLFVFVGLFSHSTYAFKSSERCEIALKGVKRAGPAVLPEAPPTPKRTPIAPRPTEPRPTEPRRREVTVPTEPGPKIPAKPLQDPKDIQPEDLYASDSRVAYFWQEMPLGLRRLMIEEMRKERAKLESYMNERYGAVDPRTLLRATLSLQTEIELIERHHKKEILNVIGQMMERRYGPAIHSLTIRITEDLPQPVPMSDDGRMIPPLPKSLDEGMVYRTEMRNLWLQGEGWVGMKEFAFFYASELNAIHPGLADKYQELDRLYRTLQLVQLDLFPLPEMVDQIPKEMISQGREIVSSDFAMVQDADGVQSIRVKVKEVNGIAVGRNGWAAAHEARKAASQMVTPAEGVFRWMMSQERREKLDEATNSARAEIRQGVFGPAVVQALKKRIDLIVGKPLEDEHYYQIMDGYFSLLPETFIHVNRRLFDSSFESNTPLQREVRELLKANGVIE